MQDEEVLEDEKENPDEDYIEAIKNLKANTVSKEDYLKLKEKNKQLVDALLNDNHVQQEEKKPTVEELKKELNDCRKKIASASEEGLTNLEYVSTALKTRKVAMQLGLQDPFVGNPAQGPTDFDFESAQKVADKLQKIVDESEGNPSKFRNLFDELVREDSKLPVNRKKY